MKANPAQFDIRKGALIGCGDREYVITHVGSLSQVIAKNLESGSLETLSITDIHLPARKLDKEIQTKDRDLEDVPKEAWEEAQRRLKLIEPLLRLRERGSADAERIAHEHGISFVTLYRWRRRYLDSGLLSSLLPGRPDGGKGKPRLKDAQGEEALRQTIDDYYLTDAQPSFVDTWEYLDQLCHSMEIKTTSFNTLRKRIEWRNRHRNGIRRAGVRLQSAAGSSWLPVDGLHLVDGEQHALSPSHARSRSASGI
jgi:putative transposase